MAKDKKKKKKQAVIGKKPAIALPTKPNFNFKKPVFNNKGLSFKMSFRTQNRGAK